MQHLYLSGKTLCGKSLTLKSIEAKLISTGSHIRHFQKMEFIVFVSLTNHNNASEQTTKFYKFLSL